MKGVHGPGPKRGSMDQGSMFCPLPFSSRSHRALIDRKKHEKIEGCEQSISRYFTYPYRSFHVNVNDFSRNKKTKTASDV